MLTQRDVESHKKRPFVKYLLNAYVKTMEPAERSTSTFADAVFFSPTNGAALTSPTGTGSPTDSPGAHGTAEFPHDRLLWEFIELIRDEAVKLVEFLAGAEHYTVYYMLYNQYPKRCPLY